MCANSFNSQRGHRHPYALARKLISPPVIPGFPIHQFQIDHWKGGSIDGRAGVQAWRGAWEWVGMCLVGVGVIANTHSIGCGELRAIDCLNDH